jgi:hypothetical protein
MRSEASIHAKGGYTIHVLGLPRLAARKTKSTANPAQHTMQAHQNCERGKRDLNVKNNRNSCCCIDSILRAIPSTYTVSLLASKPER